MIIYHIATQKGWEEARLTGQYSPPSLAVEGFIHASTREQVVSSANLFFRGQTDLVLLVIDSEKISCTLCFDLVTTQGRQQLFPHIYGPLNLDSIVQVIVFNSGEDGLFSAMSLPD